MAIYRLLQGTTFGPREISKMTMAYEVALIELGIDDRQDYRTEIIALAIIHRAKDGETDVRRLVDFAADILRRQTCALGSVGISNALGI